MTLSTRELGYADVAEMASIVASRPHMLQATTVPVEMMRHRIIEQMTRGACFIGVFIDGALDGFVSWKRVGQMPRADDISRSEEGAMWDMLWTRKRPDREKVATGDPAYPFDDVAVGTLFNACQASLEAAGIFTAMSVVPTVFVRPYYENVLFAANKARRVTLVAATAPALGLPEGPLEDYVRGVFPTHATEASTFRIFTVLDEHRP